MLLKKLMESLETEGVKGNRNLEIQGVAYDSRKVKQDYIFVCVDGKTVDGHSFIPFALENGAKALIVEKDVEVPPDVTVIRVKDSRLALACISDTFYGHPSAKFKLVGITGTKGKTTTTYMVKAILEKHQKKVGLIGTLGSRIGSEHLATQRTTPESLDLQSIFEEMVEKEVSHVVMEVSSQGLALNRVTYCQYEIGVFTNITQDHIGPKEHQSFEEYLEAKKKLFQMCKIGLINKDAKYSDQVMKDATCSIMTYGIDKDAEIKAVEIEHYPSSVCFKVLTPWFSGPIKVGMPGKFSVYNALAAIGVCGMLGADLKAVQEGLERISVPGRAEVIYSGDDYTVLTDYAHTPDSFENILTTFKAFAPGRLVCVFGCGGDRDKSKRPIMAEIASRLADFTIITSDNPRTEEPEAILDDIEKGIAGTKAHYIRMVDRREAIKYAMKNYQPKDVIILAGKGDETYQIFGTKQIHFDEREVVREIRAELLDQ